MNRCNINFIVVVVAFSFPAAVGPAHTQVLEGNWNIAGSDLLVQVDQQPEEKAKKSLKRIYNDIKELSGNLDFQSIGSLAYECAVITDGYFDPTAEILYRLWFGQAEVPGPGKIRRALKKVGYRRMMSSENNFSLSDRFITRPWILERLRQKLREFKDQPDQVLINFDQQILVYPKDHIAALTIEHPVLRNRAVTTITIRGGSLATVGDIQHSVQRDGQNYSSIINPKTGLIVPFWGSLSVWSGSAFKASCLARGLYAMGPAKAQRWLDQHPDVSALMIVFDAQLLRTLKYGDFGDDSRDR